MNCNSKERIHGIDAIRASMMLLGVALHTGNSFMTLPTNVVWPYADPASARWVDFLVLYIHAFRMPVFFVIAGFSTALLWVRRGSREFIRNRFQRIVIPLLVGWLFLYPVTKWVFGLAMTGHFAVDWSIYDFGWTTPGILIHLWFLYYLIFYYALFLLYMKLSSFFPLFKQQALVQAGSVLTSRLRVVLSALPTILLILPSGKMYASTAVLPDAFTLCLHGYFFYWGAIWFFHQDKLETLKKNCFLNLFLASILMAANFALESRLRVLDGKPLHLLLASSVASGLLTWLFIFGIMGTLLSLFTKKNRVVEYLVDASYWLYLIHLPLCVMVTVLLKNWQAPVLQKYTGVASIVYLICLSSYQLFVRHTFLGLYLNGKRPQGNRRQFFRPVGDALARVSKRVTKVLLVGGRKL